MLLDFGITRPVGDFTKLTAEGMLVGTPLSMAPEQLEFLPVDGRTDVYATGCLLYYLLTARHPIEEHTMEELRRRVLQGDYAALRVRRPDVSRALEDVVEKAMATVTEKNSAFRGHPQSLSGSLSNERKS